MADMGGSFDGFLTISAIHKAVWRVVKRALALYRITRASAEALSARTVTISKPSVREVAKLLLLKRYSRVVTGEPNRAHPRAAQLGAI